ncbi:NUDIX hydrolase [Chungangia koreensis]|uniref:NUDIX hydrolase n=1 Tax=Chungangia koreensis TaxID=752657 RepID=A0ABV8X8W7_9LACT
MGYIEEIRAEVGNRPLILVGATVAVLNKQNELLLQKRTDGVWGLPGGFMELGESAPETARREVKEETGVIIGEVKLVDVFSGKEHYTKLPNGDEYYSVTIAYFTRDIIEESIHLCSSETIDAGFFPLHSLPKGTSHKLKEMIQRLSASI